MSMMFMRGYIAAMPGLSGRHVVISGGAGALGRAVVDLFCRTGAVCHVPIRGPEAKAAAVGVNVVPGVDLTNESAVARFYAALPDDLWASVHLAGGFAMGGITETSLGDLRSQIDVNLVTAFLCCREAVRRFRLRPGGGGGRIVNVASRAAVQPGGQHAAYNMAKAAVASLTASLADELKTEQILVNAVAPGVIDTPMNRTALPDLDGARLVTPAQIASVILWLASPENTIASGAVIPVYGNS
jgi:NAD(P)-dependent dehydrogenase (short-subunit alcohol dehydrogenase family)